MGATANLSNELQVITSGLDSVVIRRFGAGIIGGRTLDVSGYPHDVIKAGHIIIQSTEDETLFKPMPLAASSYNSYDSLPSNHKYAGVLVRSVTKDAPLAAIMYNGEVNDEASPYPITSIKSALATALPGLVFMHD